MRCLADVPQASVEKRSRNSPTDRRCQRLAVTRGLCAQHAAMRECAYSACTGHATMRQAEWWFCPRHGRLYRDHNLIVERIRRITPHD